MESVLTSLKSLDLKNSTIEDVREHLNQLPIPYTTVPIQEGVYILRARGGKGFTKRKDMTYVSQHLRNQVEVLKDQLKRFICQHYEYYPLADVCSCGCSSCNQAKLNAPNPNNEIYTSLRKNTNLK